MGSTVWSIRTPSRTVLVDAGAGDALRATRPETGRLADRMLTCDQGPAPADITDIVLTHLHVDHIGGLMDGTTASFPKAVLHISEAEWTYWRDPGLMTRLPRAQQAAAAQVIRLIDGLDYEVEFHPGAADLGEGITLHPAPGHTPGHTIVLLDSSPDQVLIAADTLICAPMQLAHPEITYDLDTDPVLAVQTRQRLFDMVSADGIPFAATHMKTLSLGQLGREGGGYRFQPV